MGVGSGVTRHALDEQASPGVIRRVLGWLDDHGDELWPW